MKKTSLAALSLVVLAGCFAEPSPVQEKISLPQAREGFKSKLVSRSSDRDPVENPPERFFARSLLIRPPASWQPI